jgi:hypothetical protein
VEPPTYRQVKTVARHFPSEDAIVGFQGVGVRYVVVHQAGYGPNQWARVERDLPRFQPPLREVARFGGDVVYALAPPAPTPPR